MTSKCGKNKDYVANRRRVAWVMFLYYVIRVHTHSRMQSICYGMQCLEKNAKFQHWSVSPQETILFSRGGWGKYQNKNPCKKVVVAANQSDGTKLIAHPGNYLMICLPEGYEARLTRSRPVLRSLLLQ